jgi:hypothetical protein
LQVCCGTDNVLFKGIYREREGERVRVGLRLRIMVSCPPCRNHAVDLFFQKIFDNVLNNAYASSGIRTGTDRIRYRETFQHKHTYSRGSHARCVSKPTQFKTTFFYFPRKEACPVLAAPVRLSGWRCQTGVVQTGSRTVMPSTFFFTYTVPPPILF